MDEFIEMMLMIEIEKGLHIINVMPDPDHHLWVFILAWWVKGMDLEVCRLKHFLWLDLDYECTNTFMNVHVDRAIQF